MDYADPEEHRIRAAYAKRDDSARYSCIDPANLFMEQEWERKTLRLLKRQRFVSLGEARILDVGCGAGGGVLRLLRWGARPENITGIDLLEDRIADARQVTPSAVRYECVNARKLQFPDETFNLVTQSTVFTSILDEGMRSQVAAEMVRVLKPTGLIVWYDFSFDNPGNRDVRGIPRTEVRRLFPECSISLERVTLAPPITRFLAPFSILACQVLGRIPFLCTHYLGAIRKNRQIDRRLKENTSPLQATWD